MQKLALIPVLFSLLLISTAGVQNKNTKIVLSKDNTLTLTGPVNSESVAKIVHDANEMDDKLGKSKKPIYLILNTPGGDIDAGLELIDNLKSLNRKVHTITVFAASMGFQIVEALDDRYIVGRGIMMAHRAAGGFQGSFGGQNPSQLQNRYTLWISRLTEMDALTVKRSNGKQTLESYQKAYAEEMWRTSDQSVSQGYSDKVVNVKCDDSLKGLEDREAEFLGMHISYQIDKCPMNTGVLNVKVSIPTNKGMKEANNFNNLGGSFGPDCLLDAATNRDKLCALDTTLSLDKIKQIKASFTDQVSYNKNRVIPLNF